MSIAVTRHIWSHSPVKGSPLIVLLALADYADASGRCWPSIRTLAHKCRLSERQVQRLLPRLEAAGALRIERGGGRARASRYCIPLAPPETPPDSLPDSPPDSLPDSLPPEALPKGDSPAQRVTCGAPKGDSMASPDPGLDPSSEPEGSAGAPGAPLSAPGDAPSAPGDAPSAPGDAPSAPGDALSAPGDAPLALWRALVRRRPSAEQARLIRAAIPADAAALTRWRETVRAWLARGYRPTNVQGQIDVFRHGFRSGGPAIAAAPRHRRPAPPPAPVSDAFGPEIVLDPALVRCFAERRASHP